MERGVEFIKNRLLLNVLIVNYFDIIRIKYEKIIQTR